MSDLTIDAEGEAMIAGFEGKVDHPYWDQAGVATICVGHVIKNSEAAVYPWDEHVSQEVCDTLLRGDLAGAISDVQRAVDPAVLRTLPQRARNALIDLQFNAGALTAPGCTLLKKLNAWDFRGAADEFPKWNHRRDPKTGQLVEDKGLTVRRMVERRLFLEVVSDLPALDPHGLAGLIEQATAQQFDLRPDVLSPERSDEAPPTPRNDLPPVADRATIPDRKRTEET